MKKKPTKYSAFFEPRVFISFLLLFGASLLAMTGFTTADAQGPRRALTPPSPSRPVPDVVQMVGAVLVAHVGMDRAAGYGLKLLTSFQDTTLGRIGKRRAAAASTTPVIVG